MGSGTPPKVAEYVKKYLRSPAMREQMMFLLNRIALGECVTWSEVASTSIKLHFQKLRAAGMLVCVIRSLDRRSCLVKYLDTVADSLSSPE
ncbi:MAG: hypothetical protein QXZ22_09260 [Sulfolobales archaeon]